MDNIKNGAIQDPRPEEKKALDYIHTTGVTPVTWVEKKTWKRYKQRNQNGSYSCVFQAGAKAIEVLTGKVVSASPYFWRKNYPNEGSFLQDMGDVYYNRYTCLEAVSPSQFQNEVVMNTIKQLTTNIGVTGYRTIRNAKDIEQIAEAIEAYKQCVVLLESNSNEYQLTPIYLGGLTTFGHGICAVDYGLVNGVKTIACEDSAGQTSSPDGLRLITQDFLQHRVFAAMYFLGVKDVSVPQDKFLFTKDMGLGSFGNNVKELQKRLGVKQTGLYWTMTRDAVRKYQKDHGIINTGFCGTITRSYLNS
jgi:hypothetical protein